MLILRLVLLAVGLIGALAWAVWAQPAPARSDRPTTIFIVRHAQKADEADHSAEAELSERGKASAQRLAHVLASASLAGVYATPTRRAIQTGRPAAERFSLGVTPYNPRDVRELVERVLREHAGRSVLIVGHSNTVIGLVEAFGADAGDGGDVGYEELFIVTAWPDGAAAATKLHLAPAPPE